LYFFLSQFSNIRIPKDNENNKYEDDEIYSREKKNLRYKILYKNYYIKTKEETRRNQNNQFVKIKI